MEQNKAGTIIGIYRERDQPPFSIPARILGAVLHAVEKVSEAPAKILNRIGVSDLASDLQPIEQTRILLYFDLSVIQDIRAQCSLQSLVNRKTMDRLRKSILGQSCLPPEFAAEGLIGLDEFTIKPTAKWNWPAEFGAEFELKWNLSDTKSIESTLRILISEIPHIYVHDLVVLVKDQNQYTPIENVIYPGKPVAVKASLKHETDILYNEILLRCDDECVIAVFNNDHFLGQTKKVLPNRPILLCGLIQETDSQIKIKTGALLLCDQ